MPSVLSLQGLTKTFDTTLAVSDVSLEVNAGQVVGFLGPNGAGKTTTLRLALGLLRPSVGTATVLGHAAGSDATRAVTAYVPGDVDDAREGLEVVSASKGAVATNSALNLGDAGTVDDGP